MVFWLNVQKLDYLQEGLYTSVHGYYLIISCQKNAHFIIFPNEIPVQIHDQHFQEKEILREEFLILIPSTTTCKEYAFGFLWTIIILKKQNKYLINLINL